MEVYSVMDDENCSRRDVDLCRGYMLDTVSYFMNFYRKLGDVFGQMIHGAGGGGGVGLRMSSRVSVSGFKGEG